MKRYDPNQLSGEPDKKKIAVGIAMPPRDNVKFDDFPDLVLHALLSFLDAKSLCAVEQTSKKLLAVSPKAWEGLFALVKANLYEYSPYTKKQQVCRLVQHQLFAQRMEQAAESHRRSDNRCRGCRAYPDVALAPYRFIDEYDYLLRLTQKSPSDPSVWDMYWEGFVPAHVREENTRHLFLDMSTVPAQVLKRWHGKIGYDIFGHLSVTVTAMTRRRRSWATKLLISTRPKSIVTRSQSQGSHRTLFGRSLPGNSRYMLHSEGRHIRSHRGVPRGLEDPRFDYFDEGLDYVYCRINFRLTESSESAICHFEGIELINPRLAL